MKWISNKTLFNIHGWLGLNLGLLLFVICFSGTFATLSKEVDWLLDTDMRVEKQDAPVQWETMYKNLQQQYPEAKISGISKSSSRGGRINSFASDSYIQLPNGQTRKVYLDPYSGEIQGNSSFFNVQRFFRSYHRRFFDGNRGIFIITLSSFFLLFSALTGFLFYKGWLKNLFKLRIGRGIKTLFSDTHKLVGIWSLVFTMIIALTGVFYFVELMVQAADNYDVMVPEEPAKIKQEELRRYGSNPKLLSLNTYAGNAKKAFPDLEISDIYLPDQPENYVVVQGRAGNIITRNRANKVYLHPFNGEVVRLQRSAELNTAEFITDMADPLHFGYFGGLTTKIIWFIFGLALSFAILSGTYLWYVRGIQKMKRKLRRRDPPAESQQSKPSVAVSGFFSRHLSLSRGAVISTAIIVVYLITTSINTVQDGIRAYGPLPEERIATIQELTLGPWQVQLQCEYPCTLEGGTSFIADFQSEGLPNYESLAMNVISSAGDTVSIPFEGSAQQPSLSITEAAASAEVAGLQLSVQALDGDMQIQSVDMATFLSVSAAMHTRFDQYPERAYPKVPWDVYIFIAFFGLLVVSVIVAWMWFLVRATARRQKLISA